MTEEKLNFDDFSEIILDGNFVCDEVNDELDELLSGIEDGNEAVSIANEHMEALYDTYEETIDRNNKMNEFIQLILMFLVKYFLLIILYVRE